MHVKFGALSTALLLFLLGSVSSGASAVNWQPNLEQAQVLAAHSNRLVLLHFWGNGCPPCKWMEREVFSRPDVAGTVDRAFVAVKIDKDQFPAVARQYGVAAVPTDVIITPQGQVLGSYVGRTEPAEFMNRLNQVAQRAAVPVGQSYAAQAPGAGAPPSAPSQGYARNSGQGYQLPQMPQNYPAGGPADGIGQHGTPYPYQGMTQNQAAAAPVMPRYTDQFNSGPNAPPTSSPGQLAMSGQMNGSQGPAPGLTAPSHNTNSYNSNQMRPADGTMMQPAAPAQQNASVPTTGNPPLALDGFCPVSLERTMRNDPQPKWIPGDPRWGLRHEGRTYLFAGPEEQQTFFNNPNFYAPVLSGNDPVLLVEQGRQVAGVREFGARWRDHVYLFSCQESFEKFKANPSFYEAEVLGSRQAAADPASSYRPHVGSLANPPYGYR